MLWVFILHQPFCIASVAKQVRKLLFQPVSSSLRAGLSGHLLPSCCPTGTHIMAELNSDWLIIFVPAPVREHEQRVLLRNL